MSDVEQHVTPETARALAHAGSVSSAELVAARGGWYLRLQVGMEAYVLGKARQRRPRQWRQVERALRHARDELGLADVMVRMANWDTRQGEVV